MKSKTFQEQRGRREMSDLMMWKMTKRVYVLPKVPTSRRVWWRLVPGTTWRSPLPSAPTPCCSSPLSSSSLSLSSFSAIAVSSEPFDTQRGWYCSCTHEHQHHLWLLFSKVSSCDTLPQLCEYQQVSHKNELQTRVCYHSKITIYIIYYRRRLSITIFTGGGHVCASQGNNKDQLRGDQRLCKEVP